MGKTEPIQFIHDTPYIWDVQKRIPDTTKAKELLEVNCNTKLEEALHEIVPWIIEQIKLGTI